MMLIVTSRRSTQQPQDFAFQVATLEAGLAFISNLAASGETLFRVILVDKHRLIPLPVLAFDGADVTGPLQELEAC